MQPKCIQSLSIVTSTRLPKIKSVCQGQCGWWKHIELGRTLSSPPWKKPLQLNVSTAAFICLRVDSCCITSIFTSIFPAVRQWDGGSSADVLSSVWKTDRCVSFLDFICYLNLSLEMPWHSCPQCSPPTCRSGGFASLCKFKHGHILGYRAGVI